MTRNEMKSLRVLHQTADWIAIEKPPGISVHNEEKSHGNLMQQLQTQLQVPTLHLVHRLDKETSGVQLLAFHPEAAARMAQQFENRTVQKFYEGIVAGQIKDSGVWKQPLSDKAEGRSTPQGKAQDRKPCETRFETMRMTEYLTWLRFQILTGRQHQIRKHCVLNRHALIGDPRYGNPAYNTKITQIYGFNRMALHCAELILENGLKILSPAPEEFWRLFPESKPLAGN